MNVAPLSGKQIDTVFESVVSNAVSAYEDNDLFSYFLDIVLQKHEEELLLGTIIFDDLFVKF